MYPQYNFFEGEGAATTPNPDPKPPVVQPPPTPPPANQQVPPVPPPKKTFTQEEVNQLNAEERKKWLQKNKELADTLSTLQQNQNLTQQQRDELQANIDQLQATYRTEKETKELEIGKLQKKYDTDTNNLKKDSETWKRRFEQNLKSVDISRAAVKYNAWNPSQIEAILLPDTQVRERVGEDGKATGIFEPRVNFKGRDKENKDVMLDLSVDEAVKQMVEMTDIYGNLFKNTSIPGVGGNTNGQPVSGGRLPNIENMDLEAYKKNREKIHKEMTNFKGT